MVLSGRVALLAVLGAVVVGFVLPSSSGVLLVSGVIVAIVAVDVNRAGSVRELTFRRGGATTVRLGETAPVNIVVRNGGNRRVTGRIRDGWPPSAGVVTSRFDIELAPSESARLIANLQPTRRGDRHADRVTVRSMGPLRLAGRQATHAVPWHVRVLPPFHSRKHLPSRLARLRELDGRSAIRVRGVGTEFDSLREYVIGDDVRSIDWRATARRSEVVVRTWQPERDRHVLIVIDSGRTSAMRVEDAPRLDATMESALLLGALASHAGDRVDLLAYDRQVRVDVARPAPSEVLPSMVNALADLEPELLETDHRRLTSEVLRRAGQHAFVVILTGLDAGTVEDGLLAHVDQLTRRHTVLVASVSDPALDEMADKRGDLYEVYGAAAAERDRAARGQVADLLVRRGAYVVDAVPNKLAPAVADAYLDLKAMGKL